MATTLQIKQLMRNIEKANTAIEDIKEDIEALDIARQDTDVLKGELQKLMVERDNWTNAINFLIEKHKDKQESEHESEHEEE